MCLCCSFFLLFVATSVSVSDLQPHAELDPDSDGSFTEAEAQVCLDSRPGGGLNDVEGVERRRNETFPLFLPPCVQALLGGTDKVDPAAFESIWSNIKEKYVSLVSPRRDEERTRSVRPVTTPPPPPHPRSGRRSADRAAAGGGPGTGRRQRVGAVPRRRDPRGRRRGWRRRRRR